MTFCPEKVVVAQPIKVFNDVFQPQIVKIVHPVEIINRLHCVPVPRHVFTFVSSAGQAPSGHLKGKKGRIASVKKK